MSQALIKFERLLWEHRELHREIQYYDLIKIYEELTTDYEELKEELDKAYRDGFDDGFNEGYFEAKGDNNHE
jgi:flagellar biosynthesis/type III secretory pathway protein FliH